MARPLNQIIAHIRAVAENPSISTTLIQTEDLLLLCDAAEMDRQTMVDAIISAHCKEAEDRFPVGAPDAIREEMETYRPYAERDVDAILAAIKTGGGNAQG